MLMLPLVGLVLLTFVSILAVPCNMLALPLLRVMSRVRPEIRSPLVLLLIALPWLVGSGVLISSVVDIVFGACDTGQVCLWNEDPHLVESRRVLLVLPLLAGMFAVTVRLARQLIVSRSAVSVLKRTSSYDPDDDIHLVASRETVAFATGGQVFISTGLRAALAPREFQAVLLHERAHLQRSDGACQLVARILSCMLIEPIRQRVLAALTLANEQACDEAAAKIVGRLDTAAAILAAERLHGQRSLVLSPAFSESFVVQRVRCLMAPEPAEWRAAKTYVAIICALLSVFLVGDVLYYVGMVLLYPSSVT